VTAGSGYTVGSPSSQGATIADNDTAAVPALSIQVTASIVEGDRKTKTVNLTVTLSASSTQTVTVQYATANGTASSGSDYVARSGTLTFAPGVLTQTISVTVNGDRTAEANETFTVTLSGPVNATLTNAIGTVTITNDDGSPLLASSAPPTGQASASSLTTAQLRSVLAEAKAAWLELVPSADFTGLSVSIADLDGLVIGQANGRSITLDADAAGWGWSIGSAASAGTRMDLLSAVMHELGHVLGYEHGATGVAHDVMQPTLEPGWQAALVPATVGGPIPVADASRPGPPPPELKTPPELKSAPPSPGTLLAGLEAVLGAAFGLLWALRRIRLVEAPARLLRA
jgi:hypothetical protein